MYGAKAEWGQARWDSRTADQGALTLSGGSAALRLGRGLFATNGALRLSGQPVTLRLTRKLVARQLDTLALTGGAAALRLGRRLPAVAGTLALSGQVATLRVARSYRLTAVNGRLNGSRTLRVCTLSMPAAASNGQPRPGFSYRMPAANGTLTLTGYIAGLVTTGSYQITANTGTLALTGAHGRIEICASIAFDVGHRSADGSRSQTSSTRQRRR